MFGSFYVCVSRLGKTSIISDLANPKSNSKTAGFTKEEREGFTNMLAAGFIDSFRTLYPDVKSAYSYWTYMSNARAKNVGWSVLPF